MRCSLTWEQVHQTHHEPPLVFLLISDRGLGLLFFFRKELFHLAVLMIKIDCIAFGGGFASVPLMFHEVV
jgi:chromate transporter